uniref:Zinc finger, CCHC-type n=1 Tax=Tanacetum cinerariifolium TaxID=118510 RepID=A0A6L2KPE3_TANCI|nr:zinc finger, CCHC-type [Tanacetum cinerariifolium]
MEWDHNPRIVLFTEDKLPFLEQPIPVLPVPLQGQANPLDVITLHQAWMKSYIGNLERLGHAMTQNLSVSLILVSLRKEYNSFVQNYNMHSIGKTVNELHAMLKLHEQTLPPKEVSPALDAIRVGRIQKNQNKKSHKATKGNQRKSKAKMGYAPVQVPSFSPKPKNPPTPKKDNLAKYAICYQCGEVGHWRRNYPIYLSELIKKKKLSHKASTSGIFTMELYSYPSTSWVYDTGCEKLQHDGLLDSADIKSFGKCVACMSGKMERKPYHIKWKGPKIYLD